MKQTPEEQFREWLVGEEIISYSEYNEKVNIPHKTHNYLLILFFILFWILFLFKLIFAILFLFIIPFILKFIPGSEHLKFDTTEDSSPPFETFAFTNKRMILLNKEHKLTSIPYRNIYNLVNRGNRLEIVIDPFINESLYKISSKYSLREVSAKLFSIWEDKSPYSFIDKRMQVFTNIYDLEYNPFVFGKNETLSLYGIINGNTFSFELEHLLYFKYMEIKINCSNEEKNYLSIHQEKLGEKIFSLTRIQDHKIGIHSFDSKFVIQSNHKKFVNYVLQEEITKKINQATNHLKGEISMGTPAKMSTEKTIENIDEITLDAHLISRNESKIERTKNQYSQLTYISKELRYTNDFDKLAQDIILNLEMIISLAARINAYDGK